MSQIPLTFRADFHLLSSGVIIIDFWLVWGCCKPVTVWPFITKQRSSSIKVSKSAKGASIQMSCDSVPCLSLTTLILQAARLGFSTYQETADTEASWRISVGTSGDKIGNIKVIRKLYDAKNEYKIIWRLLEGFGNRLPTSCIISNLGWWWYGVSVKDMQNACIFILLAT